MLYRLLYARVLSRFDAETVHTLTVRGLGAIGRIAPGPSHALLRALTGAASPDPRLRVRALGLEFPSPLGVAAGLDKNLDCFEELGALGFGYVEIGTVTAEPQPGNPRPRIYRLPADRALLNSMGFPNPGAPAAARRLQRPRDTLVAVNIGRSKVATDAEADYRRSVIALAPHADLLVLNVSSPNTPGLRDLQAVDVLRGLVQSVRAALQECGAHPPLLVKIAPDLDDGAVDAIADAALELSLDGLVCTNTTIARAGLASPEALTARPGGISGAPLKRRSLEVLRRVRARVGDRVVLVSVGGVEGPDDALARIRAGATLVQAYTGFVYGGPGWAAEVNRGLLQRLESVGAGSVQELVGTEAPILVS
jgi:dihydroorotate dehydrogenase